MSLAVLKWFMGIVAVVHFKILNFRHLVPLAWIRMVNPLYTGDAIWRHTSGSTLTQVMARCPTAPSLYLNKCVHVPMNLIQDMHSEIALLKLLPRLPGANELTMSSFKDATSQTNICDHVSIFLNQRTIGSGQLVHSDLAFRAWMSKYTSVKQWVLIIHPFPNFKRCSYTAFKFRIWVYNYIPHKTKDVFSYSCHNRCSSVILATAGDILQVSVDIPPATKF